MSWSFTVRSTAAESELVPPVFHRVKVKTVRHAAVVPKLWRTWPSVGVESEAETAPADRSVNMSTKTFPLVAIAFLATAGIWMAADATVGYLEAEHREVQLHARCASPV
jgi:hypothetical protein